MSNAAPQPPKSSGVSPARRAVSMILLLVALVVLVVELRSGLGQSWSAKALAAKAPDGLFPEGFPLTAATEMMTLFPQVTTVRENDVEVVHQYRWHSMLRPLMGHPASELYLVSRPTNPPTIIAFYTDKQDAEKGLYGDPVEVRAEDGAMMPVDELPADPFGISDAPETAEKTTN